MKLPHRRRREGRTDYRARLELLKSGKPRLVVRKSLKNIICQIVGFAQVGDSTLVSSDSRELKNFGWTINTGNMPAAYLTGLLCAVKAKEKKIPEAIPDLGLYQSVKGSRLYAAIAGTVAGGLQVPHSEEALPSQEKLSGKHIADYAVKLKKEKPTQYKKLFSGYISANVSPEELSKLFESVKANILSGSPVAEKKSPELKTKEEKPKPKKTTVKKAE